MTVSRRVANAKSAQFHNNIHKRGDATLAAAQKEKVKNQKAPIGPLMIGFFFFVVVGSSILGFIRAATSALA